MRKFFLLLITLALATPIFAQESSQEATPSHSQHNISVEYGFFNITDFAWIIGSIFTDASTFFVGDISINYGYEVGELFETGVILNFAMPNQSIPLLTLMPRAKLNFNRGGFVNPYVELDAGVSARVDDFATIPMFHATLFGIEIGYFYTQILGWGQRGLLYAGVKIPL